MANPAIGTAYKSELRFYYFGCLPSTVSREPAQCEEAPLAEFFYWASWLCCVSVSGAILPVSA